MRISKFITIVVSMLFSLLNLSVFACNENDINDRCELIQACCEGDAEKVRACLDEGADINALHNGFDQTDGRISALCIAAGSGAVEVMKVLTEKGADLNEKTIAKGKQACFFAAQYDQPEAFRWSFQNTDNLCTDNDGRSTVEIAVIHDSVNIIQSFFKHSEFLNQMTPSYKHQILLIACVFHSSKIVSYLNEKTDTDINIRDPESGHVVFFYALLEKHFDICDMLTKTKQDKFDKTTIHIKNAQDTENETWLEYLARKPKVDQEIFNYLYSLYEHMGIEINHNRLLYRAAWGKNTFIIDKISSLIDVANPGCADARAPLMFAAENGSIAAAIKKLIQHYPVNKKEFPDNPLINAVDYAIETGRVSIVQVIIERDDQTIPTEHYDTALAYLKQQKPGMFKVIISFGKSGKDQAIYTQIKQLLKNKKGEKNKDSFNINIEDKNTETIF